MNAAGHWWCAACDEPAFGKVCQRCHQSASWVTDRPLRGDRAAVHAHQVARSHQFTPVAPERAAALFQQLFHNLNHNV